MRHRFLNLGQALGILALIGVLGGLSLALLVGSTDGTQAAPGVAPGGSLVPFMGNPESYLGLGNGTPIAVANLPRDPVNGGGCPNCFPNPTLQRYWVAIDGSESNFRDGDAYNTRWLGGYLGGCLPAMFDRTTANPAYIPPGQPGSGYNYRVHLDVTAPGAIEVYAYDPAQYYRRPPATPTDPDTADNEICQPVNLNSARPYRYATTFTLYYPDTTPDDLSDDVPVPNGSRTFTDTTTLPDPHNKWFPIGTIAADPIGDYRLQVYTNDPTGVGRNQYALALGGPRAPVSGEGFRPIDKISLYNNIRNVPTGQAIEWYLGFIPGSYAGQRVSIKAFDIGDATCATFIQLWRDGDTQPSYFDLNWTGQILNTLQTTTSGGQRPYNGQWVTLGLTLPPPGQYADSWWKIRYIVGASCQGTSTDRTVWEMGVAPLVTETPTPVESSTPTAPTETPTRTVTPPPTHTATNTPTVSPSATPTRTATSTPTCVAGWTVVSSPNVGTSHNWLWDVAALSPTDLWAVGGYRGGGGTLEQTLTMHWDGLAWTHVPSPNTPQGSTLTTVAAVASDDVWAAGQVFSSSVPPQTLILHWNGSAWTIVPSPNPGTNGNWIRAMVALAPNNVWAVGDYPNPSFARTMTLHWDGTAWTHVPSPNIGSRLNELFGVAALAPNDIWVAGEYDAAPSGPTVLNTLLLHWDGTAWTVVPSPNVGAGENVFRDITVIAPNDVWAVGNYCTSSFCLSPYTLTAHWDGSAWSIVPSPNTGASVNFLEGVSGTAPTDVWAVGFADSGSTQQTLTMRWDGGQWVIVPSPNVGSGVNRLRKVAQDRFGGAWAVGSYELGSTSQTLVERYAGPCATTPTPTRTGTPPTATATRTATVISTPTPTRTRTPGATATGSASATPSLPTPTAVLPTRTPTPLPSPSPTPLPSPSPTPCLLAFIDVEANHPFYPFIRCLACRGVVTGYADGTFRPYNDVTRGQLSKIIANAAALGNAIPSAQQTFSDVPGTQPFWLWIERLAATGAIAGYACGGAGEPCDPAQRPYFRPGAPATRGQISKITAVTAGWNGPLPPTQQTFADVPPTNPFWTWIEELARRGIISGYQCGGVGEPCDPAQRPYFRWGANTTRGQMSKIAANTFFPGCQTPVRR